MSCTENESGPFVKYFLPAVFGGLTLLVAKRWAGQVPHSSTSGISRRRRIIKDPLVRRPLSLNANKVMTQSNTSKRIDSTVRKNCTNFLATEEENLANMPPNRRIQQRNTRMSPMTANNVASASGEVGKYPAGASSVSPLSYEKQYGPKHIPFPNIPQDGHLLFEAMMFVFTALAAGSQFLNLYRTVWWLPHSYTNQSMNFYLIDPHLVMFILVVLGRRLLFCLMCCIAEAVTPPKFLPLVIEILKFVVLGVVLGALGWCTYNLMQTHPILSIFYLCYPISIYLLLFGACVTPLVHVPSGPPLTPHCCASNAPQVRQEVDLLKMDFNNRLKQIIFSSVLGAYYSSYVPWCFSQSFLYIDVYRVIRHLALVWFGLFTQHAAHCLSAKYCDHLHRAALHLGSWTEDGPLLSGANNSTITISSVPNSGTQPGGASGRSSGTTCNPSTATSGGGGGVVMQWCQRMMWSAGMQVKHGRTLYTSLGVMTAAEPGNDMHCRFYAIFHDPSTLLCCLLCAQISLVLVQLFLLFNTTEWHYVLSLALLLFSNYYTLFKLVRDYLVTWKVYQAEFTLQDKGDVIYVP